MDTSALEWCQVQSEYLQDVYRELIHRANASGQASSSELQAVGIHLLPLYSQLFRFLIHEYGVTHVMDMDDKGRYHINPLFREIRSIIKDIHIVMKDIFGSVGVKRIADPSLVQPNIDYRVRGTPSYYEAVQSGAKPPRPAYPGLRKAVSESDEDTDGLFDYPDEVRNPDRVDAMPGYDPEQE